MPINYDYLFYNTRSYSWIRLLPLVNEIGKGNVFDCVCHAPHVQGPGPAPRYFQTCSSWNEGHCTVTRWIVITYLIQPAKSCCLPFFCHGCDSLSSTTCLHVHTLIYSKYDISKYILHFCQPNAPFMNTRLVMMSASSRTQTGLRCLIIQVLNASLTSAHCNLERGLAILTESFSPLRSVLHNLSCWSPNQKWHDKPCYSYLITCTTTRSSWFDLVSTCLNWPQPLR